MHLMFQTWFSDRGSGGEPAFRTAVSYIGREMLAALFDEIYFHDAAADAAGEFASGADGHLVALPAGARTGTLGDDEEHDILTAFQTGRGKMP